LGRKSGNNLKKYTEKPSQITGKFLTKSPCHTSNSFSKNIIALIINFPELVDFRNEDFDIREAAFLNEDMTNLKELIIELIEDSDNKDPDSIMEEVAKACEKKDVLDLKNLLASIRSITLEFAKDKLSILLAKDSLLQVEGQYKEALMKNDEIDTHQSEITNQKIKEIFEYKDSLERKIIALEN